MGYYSSLHFFLEFNGSVFPFGEDITQPLYTSFHLVISLWIFILFYSFSFSCPFLLSLSIELLMSRYISQYVSTCNLYLQTKPICHLPLKELYPLLMLNTRWKTISIDFIIELKFTEVNLVQFYLMFYKCLSYIRHVLSMCQGLFHL